MKLTNGGATGTLKSTTMEGALAELVYSQRALELNAAYNPNSYANLSINLDLSGLQMRGSFEYPITVTIGLNGDLNIHADQYLTGVPAYSAGSGGTLKSTNRCAALIELFKLMQDAQALPASNPNGYTYISGSPDASQTTYSGTFTLDLGIQINADGSVSFPVKEYLVG